MRKLFVSVTAVLISIAFATIGLAQDNKAAPPPKDQSVSAPAPEKEKPAVKKAAKTKKKAKKAKKSKTRKHTKKAGPATPATPSPAQ
jgi:hypothetical protein